MRVIVIDDDPATTDLLRLILEPMAVTVIIANTGLEGIRLVEEKTPDIIILDLMMPNLDGWEVCKKIRLFSLVPILILSAVDRPGQVAEALDAGADDYLIKPIISNILIAHINKILRRHKLAIAPLLA
jgi:two-component system KDP operon response regulator KdpE